METETPSAPSEGNNDPIILFDVSAIYENSEYTAPATGISLVTADTQSTGSLLSEPGLTDALHSAYLDTVQDVRYFFVTNPVNISDYAEDGVLVFSFWTETASKYTFEIGSLDTPDNQEYQWNVSMNPGRNSVTLSFSDASKPGSSAIDLTQVLRLRVFDTTHGSNACMLGDMLVYHQRYLPGNTTGSAAEDVAIAADAIRSGLGEDYGTCFGKYTADVRVPRGTTRSEAKQKVINTLEANVTDYLRWVSNIYNVTTQVEYKGFGYAEIHVTMEDAEETISVVVNLVYYSQQKPQIVQSKYAGSELITAAIVLGNKEYPLDATGVKDCTATIQAALDDCAYIGGGTVWLPAGYYRITGTLSIPTYVTLRGDWQDPDSVTNPSKLGYGTILIVDQPAAEDPLIYMGGSTGVRGLTIYYPQQSLTDPVEYAYAIYNAGQAVEAFDRMLHTIQDITLINAYKGIGLCDSLYGGDASTAKAEQTYIMNVKGTFLNTGLYNFNASDNGGTIGFTTNAKYWCQFLQSKAYAELSNTVASAQASVDEDALRAYTREHTVGMHIGDLEGDYFSALSLDSLAYGILVDGGSRTTFYGDLIDLSITNCGIGAQFNKLSGFGVNIACSYFEGNGTDLVNNTSAAIKLSQVAYTSASGKAIYTTADDTLTETIHAYQIPTYGVAGNDNLLVFRTKGNNFSCELQAALDQVSNAGGGIVYLPAGHYQLDSPVTVPANTELRGCAGSAVRPNAQIDGGTVLEVSFGAGSELPTENAAIILSGKNAGVSGLILAFTEQAEEPVLSGYGIYAADADSCFVANISILGFSHGIYLESCNDYVVTGITFTSYENCITAANCDGGHISRCLNNFTGMARSTYDYYSWTSSATGTNNSYFAYTSDNLDCIILDGSVNQILLHWYAYRPHDAISLRNGSEVLAFNNGAGGARNEAVGALLRVED